MYADELPRLSELTIAKIQSYVYALADDEDQIFYVGKGVGNRVFTHVNQVQKMLMADANSFGRLNNEDKDDDSTGHLGD